MFLTAGPPLGAFRPHRLLGGGVCGLVVLKGVEMAIYMAYMAYMTEKGPQNKGVPKFWGLGSGWKKVWKKVFVFIVLPKSKLTRKSDFGSEKSLWWSKIRRFVRSVRCLLA